MERKLVKIKLTPNLMHGLIKVLKTFTSAPNAYLFSRKVEVALIWTAQLVVTNGVGSVVATARAYFTTS